MFVTTVLRSVGLGLAMLCLACFGQAHAAELQPASPRAVTVSPSGGFVEVEEEAAVTQQDSASLLRFVLPAGAQDLRLSVPGQTVARWSFGPQVLDTVLPQRQELQAERDRLEGLLAAVTAQRAIWQTAPQEGAFADLEKRAAQARDSLPALLWEQAVLERRIKKVDAALQALPASQELGQLVSVVLQKPVPEGQMLQVRYSYILPDCGWRPVYSFDARPDVQDAGIHVRLTAEVWQHSGLDWPSAAVTLVTHDAGPREPRPLPVWEVASGAEARRVSTLDAAAPMQVRKLARGNALAGSVAANAAVEGNSEGIYASWKLAACGLPQGRSHLVMREAVWQAPLQWLARPGREGVAPVWLLAEYTVPTGDVWPAGKARYSVDGQHVGEGIFRLEAGKAALFFGADPRVSVVTTADSRKQGESGFIDKKRVWSWAWTYTVKNRHQRELPVRLERPAPRIVDADVRLRYENSPEPKRDEKKHLLVWDVTVPAGGAAEVRHGLNISAPKELELQIVAP